MYVFLYFFFLLVVHWSKTELFWHKIEKKKKKTNWSRKKKKIEKTVYFYTAKCIIITYTAAHPSSLRKSVIYSHHGSLIVKVNIFSAVARTYNISRPHIRVSFGGGFFSIAVQFDFPIRFSAVQINVAKILARAFRLYARVQYIRDIRKL